MVYCYFCGFGVIEFGEDDIDGDIFNGGGREVRVCFEGGMKDGCEKFFWVGIFEGIFV